MFVFFDATYPKAARPSQVFQIGWDIAYLEYDFFGLSLIMNGTVCRNGVYGVEDANVLERAGRRCMNDTARCKEWHLKLSGREAFFYSGSILLNFSST